MRIVLDTNILIRANHRSRSTARDLLLEIVSSTRHRLLVSRELLAEVSRVLRYDKLQKMYSLSEEDIYTYTQEILMLADRVILNPAIDVPIRDPKDVPILLTALQGRADALCTADPDFFAAGCRTFCSNFGIDVCSEGELWQRIRLRDPE